MQRKTSQKQSGAGMFSSSVTPKSVQRDVAKIPPGDLIYRMNNMDTTQHIKKTSTLAEQDAITKLAQTIDTAVKQKVEFDKATRDFYTVYEKLKVSIMDACETGPKLCSVVNNTIKPNKNA
jgi:C-terminal processing protease CtpA/Prc